MKVLALFKYFILLMLTIGLCCLPLPALAQELSSAEISTSDRLEDLEEFADQFFDPYVGSQIPGLALVVVQGDKQIFSKGYGYANLEESIPVDPEKTLFRVGSVSKLMTVGAVLQLVEEGKIDLESPVEAYLNDLPIQNSQYPPIKVKHLLDHTDGFDVAWSVHAATLCEEKQQSLKQFLIESLPQRVLPPGRFFLYGDSGISIAGHLLEVISEKQFVEYIDQKIIEPLQMKNSSFLQPLPGHLNQNIATGYQYREGDFIPAPFLCNKSTPTIGLSATPNDIAKLIVAQLNTQSIDENYIFSSNVLEAMHQSQLTNFPTLPRAEGTTYGFFERFQNGHRAIEHGGSMYGFISHFFLMPDENVGWFLVYNTNNLEDSIREEFITQFLDRYFPGDEPSAAITESKPSPAFQEHFSELDGTYQFIRYPKYSIGKLGAILLGRAKEFQVRAKTDGKILVLPDNTEWIEVEPLLFQLPDTSYYFRFFVGEDNRIEAMALSGFVSWIYGKIPWYETRNVQLTILAIWNIIYLSILSGSLYELLKNRKKQFCQSSRAGRLTQRLIVITSAINIFFLITFVILFRLTYYWEFFVRIPLPIFLLLHLPTFTAVLSALTVGLGLTTQLNSLATRWQKAQFGLFTIASLLFIFSMRYWNIIGFKLY